MAPYINLRRYTEIDSDSRIGVEGRYRLEAIDPSTKMVLRDSGWFHNIFTDIGMDAIGTGSSFFAIRVGTGTATPAVTDTQLQIDGVQVGIVASANNNLVSPSAPYWGGWRGVATSAIGGATGVWTEVGVFPSTTNTNARSRALILDSMGNPTSFPVLASEQLQVTYEFRHYAPTVDNPASITMSGTPYTATTRALGVTTGSNGWGLINMQGGVQLYGADTSSSIWSTAGLVSVTAGSVGSPVGSYGLGSGATVAYVGGTYFRESQITYPVGAATNSALRTHQFGLGGCLMQVEFNPTINKTSTQQIIVRQRTYWARR